MVGLLCGFLILPTGQKGAYGLDTFSAICRAIGVPSYGVNARGAPAGTAQPVSQVAWTSDTRRLLANASPERGPKLATEVCGGCHGENGVSVAPRNSRTSPAIRFTPSSSSSSTTGRATG